MAALYGTPWAITEPGLHLIGGIVEAHVAGMRLSAEEKAARAASTTYGSQAQSAEQRVALINLHGPILSRANDSMALSGYTDPQAFAQTVRRMADDPAVSRIVLSIDSPGGTVSGTRTAAEAVSYAASRKEVVAVADDLAASAAYWIGSQATQFVVDPGAQVGSIGVLLAIRDTSGRDAKDGVRAHILRTGDRKALGQPGEVITDDTLNHYRATLDTYAAQFVEAVAAGRGVPLATAQGWATGETWIGQAAVNAGLADHVGTIRQALAGDFSAPTTRQEASRMTPEQLAALGLQADASDTEIMVAIQAGRRAQADYLEAERNTIAALALPEGAAAPSHPLYDLAGQAADGRAYREAQLERLHALTIVTHGNHPAGIQAADDAREVYAGQPIARITAQIARLEGQRDTLPSGPLSMSGTPKSAPQTVNLTEFGLNRRR